MTPLGIEFHPCSSCGLPTFGHEQCSRCRPPRQVQRAVVSETNEADIEADRE